MEIKNAAASYVFFDRDLSWLSFNERVLAEAERSTVPLMERIRFLSIYSSNLDEFYRVRIPAIMAWHQLSAHTDQRKLKHMMRSVNKTVLEQQTRYGTIMSSQIIPALREQNIHLIYKEPIPESIHDVLTRYFIQSVAAYIEIVKIGEHPSFFLENNKLYVAVVVSAPKSKRQLYIVNIPSNMLPRFCSVERDGIQYIVFLDDIVKLNLPKIFPGKRVISSHTIKVTRDAELNLEDEFTGDLASKIEERILVRDAGFATRFLYEPGISKKVIDIIQGNLDLEAASLIRGGHYHNLKDLASFPLKGAAYQYPEWPTINRKVEQVSLFREIQKHDWLLHPPYHSYDTVLRFFNEASLDPAVKTIYVTLYRVAKESRIAHALISAAKNGKKVIVFVELKARFDEANNIKWAKKMKAAGVRIIESIPGLKVHAKLALVKRRTSSGTQLLGLLATGNFNEGTARFYTDHILMTADKNMLAEAETLFSFLKKRKKKSHKESLAFHHLLVGHFNMQERFMEMIDREINNIKKGRPGRITIKFNNLEDKVLISKLYQASQEGVKISLIVRGICCLVPGVHGMSENISVTRIIDRYLEHGRIFLFENNGNPEIYMGSADWMNRNVYRRIEVCFPVKDPVLKREMLEILNLYLADNCQVVSIDAECRNVPMALPLLSPIIRSQVAIVELLTRKNET